MSRGECFRAALASYLVTAAVGCAPDLTLGPAAGNGGSGGTVTTGTTMSTGGSGGGGNDGGMPVWAASLAGDGDETPRLLQRADGGELLVAAEITGTLGIDDLASAGATDVALVRFTETGKPIAAVRLGGLNPQRVHALARDNAGSTILAGDFSGSITAGAKQANSNGGQDGYVVKLDGSGGVTWIRNFGGMGHDTCAGVAADSKGNIVTAGTFTGTLDANVSSAGGEDLFVMKLAPGGAPSWTVPIGDIHDQRGRAVAVAKDDSIVVLAEFKGTPLIDGNEVLNHGGTDILLLELDKNGGVLWAKSFGTAGDDSAAKLVLDDLGGIVILGSLASALDLGDGAISGQAFIAKFDAKGDLVYSRGFASADPFSVSDIALDTESNVLVAGDFSGSLDVGPEILESAGGQDAFVVKLTAGGDFRWARSFGGADSERATAVAAGKSGMVLVAGSFFGSTMLGEDALGPTQGEDLFLVALTP
jgi:hypothetical protein